MGIRELLTERSGKRETATITLGGEPLILRGLTYAERMEIQNAYQNDAGRDIDAASALKRQALWCARSIVNEEGAAVFSDAEADLKILMGLSSLDMAAIDSAITKLNFPPFNTAKNSNPPTNG